APWVGSAAWFSLCALVCAGAAVWRGKACRGAIFAACVLAGAGWYAVRIHEPAASGLGTLLSAEGAGTDTRTLVTVEGLVLDTPRMVTAADGRGSLAAFGFAEPSTRFTLEVAAVDG